MKPDFWKNVLMGREAPKSLKNGPKMNEVFGILTLLEYERTKGLLTFCKNRMSGKNVILVLGPKNL